MAFDLSTWQTAKYRFSFTGEEGTSYIAEIHEDGHDNHTDDPTADDITIVQGVGRDSVSVTWSHDGDNEYAPMVFSEATISVYDGANAIAGDLIDALNTVDDKYLLVIREDGGDIKWAGNIDPEGITYQEDGPVPLTISAVDGLGRLGNRPYISVTDGTSADTGSASLISVIADCLGDTAFGFDFYVSSSFYHNSGLTGTDNPLENTWVNKLAFTAKKNTGDQSLVSKLSVLTEICAAWGLKCFQAEGAWHLIQANHLHTSTYRRWRYDSAGAGKVTDGNAPNDYEDINPSVAITNETLKRTVATRSFLKGYNSAAIQYQHGPIQILRAPRFEPQDQAEANQFYGGGNAYPWTTGAQAAIFTLDSGTWGMGVDNINAVASNYTGYEEFEVNDLAAKIANASGTGAGTLDNAIGSTYLATQRSQQELQSGDSWFFKAQVYLRTTGTSNPADWWGRVQTYIAFQIKHYGSSTQYLKWASDGSLDWTTTPNWLLLKNQANVEGWHSFALTDTEVIPSDGDIEVSIGPSIIPTGLGFVAEKIIWDNVEVLPTLSDGSYNYEATTSFNYIDRSQPRPVKRAIILGDGPTAYNRGSMFSDSGLSTVTADWVESTVGSGGDTNVDHSTVLGEAMLTSMRAIRPVHSADYVDLGQILSPLDVLSRSGSLYPAWEITTNFIGEYTGGSWYLADERAFTSDLESGVASGASLMSDFGRGSSGTEGFNFSRIGSSFDTLMARESDRLATVSADATSGTTVTCSALPEALNAGDPVFFQSKKTGYVMKRIVAASVAVSATSFTVTTAFSASEPINNGDPILPGSISGLRIDMDGVQIVNTHLKNDGLNAWDGAIDDNSLSPTYGKITTPGTQGWIITRFGDAEFNDVTVRGSINAGNQVYIGKDVGDLDYTTGPYAATAGEHGIWINPDNYWIIDTNAVPDKTHFKVGDSTDYMEWDETTPALKIISSGATVFDSSTASTGLALDGDLEVVSGKITLAGAGTQEMRWDSSGLTYRLDTSPVGSAMRIGWESTGGTAYGAVYYDDDSFEMTVASSSGDVYVSSAVDITLAAAGNLIITNSAGSFTWPTDVPSNGQVLTWNTGGTLTWETVVGAGSALNDLSDVTITSAAKGDILVHNGTAWVDLAVGTNDHVLTADSTQATGVKWAAAASGSGDVVGPASATDNAVARFDTTTGKLIQNSGVIIDDTNNVSGIGTLTATTLAGTLSTATQNSVTTMTALASVGTITSGTWQGTDVGVAHGGTGASTAAAARTNLGLVIGTNVQAYNAHLEDLASLGVVGAADLFMLSTASGTWSYKNPTQIRSTLSISNVEDTALSTWAGSANITTLGTIGTGTWQGTAIASAYLDADTMHLSVAQTVTGAKTFTSTSHTIFRYNTAATSGPGEVQDSTRARFTGSYWQTGGGPDADVSQDIYLDVTAVDPEWTFRIGSTFSATQAGDTAVGTVTSGTWTATDIGLAHGGTGASLADPNADRIMFWDDSAGAVTWMNVGDGLDITGGTTLQMDWSAGAGSVTPYKVIVKDNDQNIKTISLGDLATASTVNNDDWSGTDLSLANGGTGASLVDPNADRILFWDDSAGAVTWMPVGEGLEITSGTTIRIDKSPGIADAWPTKLIGFDGDSDYVSVDVSSFGSTLIDDADASAARTTLGLDGAYSETLWAQHDLVQTRADDANPPPEKTLISATAGDYVGTNTIPANYLEQGKHLRLSAAGYYENDGTNSFVLRVMWGGLASGGGTTIASKTITLPDTTVNEYAWELRLSISVDSTLGTDATCNVHGSFDVEQTDGTFTSYRLGQRDGQVTLGSINSTNDLIISGDWGTYDAVNSPEFGLMQATLEEIY